MNQRRRLLILGDSLAFARAIQGQDFPEAWPAIIQDRMLDWAVWQRCRQASTIMEVQKEFNLFAAQADDFSAFVLQVGVVDCCPRPFPYLFQRILNAFASEALHKWVNKHYHLMLRVRSRPWISLDEYRSGLVAIIESILAKNPTAKIGILETAHGAHRYLEKIADVNIYIDRYNEVLDQIEESYKDRGRVVILRPYRDVKIGQLLLDDGHHLNKDGHERVAVAVMIFLTENQVQLNQGIK